MNIWSVIDPLDQPFRSRKNTHTNTFLPIVISLIPKCIIQTNALKRMEASSVLHVTESDPKIRVATISGRTFQESSPKATASSHRSPTT